MSAWFWYAVGAAVLYGAHQIFTKLAAERISDGLGGFVVEATAALTILLYLALVRSQSAKVCLIPERILAENSVAHLGLPA